MRRMPEELINDIRSKSDIVDTISQYMTLTKKGKNYWGVCPFHDDHDPSMSVSPDRQIYKCFVCGAAGNVFSFIENFEHITFIESVTRAASRLNIDVSEYQTVNVVPKDPEKEKIYEALKEAQQFTALQLSTKDGKEAHEKLQQRGYTQATIDRFGIGVALGNNQIYNYLSAKGFDDELLIKADLIRMTDDGFRDVFYNRIMFPLHDPYGKAIGFSARALHDSNSVKYINTSETEVYTKGNMVYNFHNAKEYARKEGYLIITEGVTDAISFSTIGVENVVSLLGVACTPQQIRILKQATNDIVLAFDGDRAGLEATFAIGQKLRDAQCTVSIWYNDTGMDPDDAIRNLGPEKVKSGLVDRIGWLDFLISYAIGNYGLESFENRKRIVEFMLEHLRTEDELTQSYYTKKIADMTNFEVSVLNQQLQAKVQAPIHRQTPIVVQSKDYKVLIPERAILKQMLESKEAAYQYRDQLGFLVNDIATDFALIILDLYRKNDAIEIADILSHDIQENMRQFAIEIDSSDVVGDYDVRSLEQNIALIRTELSRLGIRGLKDEGRKQLQLDEQQRLLEAAIRLKRENNNQGGEN
ncbi:DNA primase [Erysipelothrix anatis]|uniref:DNA primase n=1 Tax=Erysipelothrix anatis TaxID=2683713 RepID=UPI00135A1041|nr:DNA primase [Erysipelothrix anatis]